LRRKRIGLRNWISQILSTKKREEDHIIFSLATHNNLKVNAALCKREVYLKTLSLAYRDKDGVMTAARKVIAESYMIMLAVASELDDGSSPHPLVFGKYQITIKAANHLNTFFKLETEVREEVFSPTKM
jgi:hypothetical protein